MIFYRRAAMFLQFVWLPHELYHIVPVRIVATDGVVPLLLLLWRNIGIVSRRGEGQTSVPSRTIAAHRSTRLDLESE